MYHNSISHKRMIYLIVYSVHTIDCKAQTPVIILFTKKKSRYEQNIIYCTLRCS